MSEAFWIAVIPAAVTAGAAIISSYLANKSRKKDDAKRDAEKAEIETAKATEEALFRQEVRNELKGLKNENSEIKKELKEHNGYAQKFTETHESIMEIRQDVALIKQDNKHMKETIRQYHGG